MVQGSKKFDKMFPIVEASKLSMDDEFMRHEPTSICQKKFKEVLTAGIKTGLKDFRRPAMDPSFKNDKIVYKARLMPATGESCNWWRENAKKFMPERNSRLGTVTEYAAFLGVLIKYLINEMGYTVSQAWKAVCDDSKELGHYWNSENAKQSCFKGFEATRSRKISLFYDLANTYKILGNDGDSIFWLAGGNCRVGGHIFPLASVRTIFNHDHYYQYAVGWLVLDA